MSQEQPSDDVVFEVETPLGFKVRSTSSYWTTIVRVKHPIMKGRMDDVISALREPGQVRVSRSDSAVFLFYRKEEASRWICAVAKRLNGDGFLITTYPTDAIKEGKQVWPR
jgi:hypothetical protein